MIRRSRRVLELFFGACLVYTTMVACGGGGSPSSGGHGQGGQARGGAGPGGTGPGPGGSDGSGIFDALMDPVPDAMADPVSGTRLKATWIESVDGARQYVMNTELDWDTGLTVTTNVWFDSMRNEQCVFRLASDGKLRCLPGLLPGQYAQRLVSSVVFSDAACTQPWVLTQQPQMNCAPYDPPDYSVMNIQATNTCETPGESGMWRVFKLGAQASVTPDTPVYDLVPSGPSLVCNGGSIVGQHYAYAATEVDASQFALVKTAVQHD